MLTILSPCQLPTLPTNLFHIYAFFFVFFETYTPPSFITNKSHEEEKEKKSPFRNSEVYSRLAEIMQETLVFCAPPHF